MPPLMLSLALSSRLAKPVRAARLAAIYADRYRERRAAIAIVEFFTGRLDTPAKLTTALELAGARVR